MKKTTYKVIPYGKWWEHLLRFKFYMAYRAIFGWRMKSPTHSIVIDNLGLTLHIPENKNTIFGYPVVSKNLGLGEDASNIKFGKFEDIGKLKG